MAAVHKDSLSTACSFLVERRLNRRVKAGFIVCPVCGSRTETMQKNPNISNSHAPVIHKNKRIAAGNSEKVVHA